MESETSSDEEQEAPSMDSPFGRDLTLFHPVMSSPQPNPSPITDLEKQDDTFEHPGEPEPGSTESCQGDHFWSIEQLKELFGYSQVVSDLSLHPNLM